MDAVRRLQEEAELRRLTKAKSIHRRSITTLSEDIVSFYRTEIKRAKKLTGIAEVWKQLLPQHLIEHTCIDSFRGGTLTVLVDSSPHLFQLRQLLLAGLQAQLINACRGQGLKKITVKSGTWYQGNSAEDRRVTFPKA